MIFSDTVETISGTSWNKVDHMEIGSNVHTFNVGFDSNGYATRPNYISVSENNVTFDSRENCNAIIETATNKLICGSHNTIIPVSVESIASFAFLNGRYDKTTIDYAGTME